MVGLLDVAPMVRTVAIGEHSVDVLGISAKGIAALLARFPDIQAMLRGKAPDAETLLNLAPDAIAAIIAAGTGYPGNEQAEQRAAQLGLELQLEFLSAIIEVTMPGGFGPFVERLRKLGINIPDVSLSSTVPDTNSPKVSDG